MQEGLDGQLSSLLSGVVLPLLEQVERDVGRQGAMFTEHMTTLKDEVRMAQGCVYLELLAWWSLAWPQWPGWSLATDCC